MAKDRQAVLLTDDLDARERAVERDVEVHGTIGIIATGYAQGLIDRDEAARRMRMLQHETRLYVTSAVVERGIEMLGDDE